MSESQLKTFIKNAEDTAEDIFKVLKPYSKTISKYFILLFPVINCVRAVLNFHLNVYEKMVVLNCPSNEGGWYAFGVFISIVLFICDGAGAILAGADKNLRLAYGLLAIYPIFSVKFLVYPFFYSNLEYIAVYLAIIASLFMMYADSLKEEERQVILGLPSLGINRPMGVVTLVARVVIVLTSLSFGKHLPAYFSGSLLYLSGVVVVVIVGCILVGYKTKPFALILSVLLFLTSLEHAASAMRYLVSSSEEDSWRMMVFFGDFAGLLAGVGGLIRLASLGGGVYSIDHLKRQ